MGPKPRPSALQPRHTALERGGQQQRHVVDLRPEHRDPEPDILERTFGETRRRVKVIGRLPGEYSCLGLVWAVLDRTSAGWRGFTMTPAGLRLLADLRRTLHDPPTQLPQRNSEIHAETSLAPTDSAAIA